MLVCNSYDIDTCKCSFDYIIGHNTRNKDVQESMLNAGDRIYKAHKEITTIVAVSYTHLTLPTIRSV